MENRVGVEAEEYRRSHCERKEASHQCVGKVTIGPGLLLLECHLCGMANEELRKAMGLCDAARVICKVLGKTWEDLGVERQRQVLIELMALQRDRR